MVLFELDQIVNSKFEIYKKKNINIENNYDFNTFKIKCIEKIKTIFPNYFTKITQEYIDNILSNKNIQIIFSCLDTKFSISNITSILIYHKTKSSKLTKYYVLILGTHKKFRKYGYGKLILDEFVEFVKNSKTNQDNKIKILLKSLDSSLNFYLNYGFIICTDNLNTNRLFYKYEPVYELKDNKEKILELFI